MALIKSNQDSDNGIELNQDDLPSENGAALDDIIANLGEGDSDIRRLAARDLYQKAEATNALLIALEDEDNLAVREAILDSLLSIANEEVVNGLMHFLRSNNAGLRNSVIEVLQACPDQVANHIDQLLEDDDPDIRIFAMDIIGLLPHPKVPDWINLQLQRENHVNALGAAIDRAAQIGEPSFSTTLNKLKEHWLHEPYIAFAIDIALSRLSEDNGTDS